MSGGQEPILIWGAGAIGGTVGAYFVKAGVPVVFVDRDADHVAAIRARGLSIEGPIAQFIVQAPAFEPHEATGVYSRVLLCVKAQDTGAAARQLSPHLARDGYVASFQNGLNEFEIAEIVGAARTMGAFLNFGADYMGPGVVQFSGRGAVVIGEIDGTLTPRARELHALMRHFEPDAELTEHILGHLWGKLGYGALLFATALTNASICDSFAALGARPLLRAIAGEATQVADKLDIAAKGSNGYEPSAFQPSATAAMADVSFDAMFAHNAKSAKTHSGIWRDLAVRKRRTEADAQLGPIVSFGAKVGVATPATQALIAMVHEIEDGRRPLAWANLAELAAKLGVPFTER